MQVSPTQVFVVAEHSASGITLLNTGGEDLYAQVRVFEWQQQNGEEKLLPTRAIVASPPMLQLAPGVNQLVRIVRNGAPPTDIESSFRIIIDELPVNLERAKQATNNTLSTPTNGLQFRLRYSIPVFLEPPKQIAMQPILSTQLIKEKDGYFLRISNGGNSHAHITDLTWKQDQQRISIASGLAGYVLPGQQRQWRLDDNLSLIGGGEFTARINGELLDRTLISITETN
ncbi:fimbrial biogenesis chaperone [Gilvimarinus polysaccharolyticus]|uniref:fimbrial biogenesis chaperone n=1 Tax=Gilvimarinus polysaccharolyticus TaxID=863921 RepID=UPI0018DCABC6|nr:molecular chaperone [Gilvimarinus polysaccharolyticus]